MVNDPISDMFIRIKNAQAVKHESVLIPASKMKESIANVLVESGYVKSVERKAAKPADMLEVTLRYDNKTPVITHLQRVSKPGLRRYSGAANFPRPLSGHGLVIVSTTQGVMSGAQAQKAGLGGEIIATVW